MLQKSSPLPVAADTTMLLFHGIGGIAGIRFLMIATLRGSARIVNQGSFSPERLFDLVERFKVTFTIASPSMIAQLLNHPLIESADLSSVKTYLVGFSKIPFELLKKLDEKLPNGKCCQYYSMTELFGPIAINLEHLQNDCVGQLVCGAEAKIVNEDGQRLGVGEMGELCIKQPFRFAGYIGDTGNYFDDDGFFATGDVGYFDENSDLFIVDRLKELFKNREYHVIPSEIEAFLDKIDGVQQSCVVPIPDTMCDNLPAAVIVKSERSNCTAESIYQAVSSNSQRKFQFFIVHSLQIC